MFERLESLFKTLWGKYKSKPLWILFWGAVALILAIAAVTAAFFMQVALSPVVWLSLLCLGPVAAFAIFFFTLSGAARIFTNWYGTSLDEAFEILLSHAIGGGYPKVKAARGALDLYEKPEEERQKLKVKMDAGVPVILTVDVDTAVLTEMDGKPFRAYTRPGRHTLLPFEQIRHAIDRRAHMAYKEAILALTRDGVHVQIDAIVGYQIRRKGTPSVEDPYPIDPPALYQATYNRMVRAGNSEAARLDELMPELLPTPVRNVVAQYRLSDLFEHSIEGLTEVPRMRLGKEVAELVAMPAGNLGLEINYVTITQIQVQEPEIRKQLVKQWAREREDEIARRVGPRQALLKADEIMTMLKALDMLREGEELTTENLVSIVSEIRELYYVLADLADLAAGEEGVTPYGGGPWTAAGIRRRRQRWQAELGSREMFQEIEEGVFDTPQQIREDRELKRQLPPSVAQWMRDE